MPWWPMPPNVSSSAPRSLVPGHPVHGGRRGDEGAGLRLLTWTAAITCDGGHRKIGPAGAKAKYSASAMTLPTDAIQILGGAAYVKDYPVRMMLPPQKNSMGTLRVNRRVDQRPNLADESRPTPR
ncbi:acyl-CoA dehydrogenase family protein [Streptomyces sp. NPDC018352]|uniref:acyl-CoA dehydrogenase family protein n=1 Tax=Streptomyces sp. NPDC018352 TaxID=3157194 RepID=UPI003408CBC5